MKAKRIAEITANIAELKKHSEEGTASMMAQAIITSKIAMLHAELSVVISTPEKKKLSNGETLVIGVAG